MGHEAEQFRLNYQFDARKHSATFVGSTLLRSPKIPERIYCFWTGLNEMSENRLEGLRSMKENAGVSVFLVTPGNLDSYILEKYPLHPAYEFLSMVHRSDYLRCYFMHHFGGGYSDIKSCPHSWKSSFEQMNQSDSWVLGYEEAGPHCVAPIAGALGDELRASWRVVVGNGAYICRSHTDLTSDWINELHARLDVYYTALTVYPGNEMGNNAGYPIPWTNILGDIFHPLCLKYHTHLSYSADIQPCFENYR